MSRGMLVHESLAGPCLCWLEVVSYRVQDRLCVRCETQIVPSQVFSCHLHYLPSRVGADLEDRVDGVLISSKPRGEADGTEGPVRVALVLQGLVNPGVAAGGLICRQLGVASHMPLLLLVGRHGLQQLFLLVRLLGDRNG